MTRDAFAFKFNGELITGTTDICKATGLLRAETIKWSDKTEEILAAKFNEDEENYYEYIDDLCVTMDNTKMFNDQVYSVIY